MTTDNTPTRVDLDAIRREQAANARVFEAIGRFMFQFSQLEFTMKVYLSAQIGLAEAHFDIVTAPYDFQMLCTVTQAISLLRVPEQKKDIDSLFKKCRSLNNERIRVAHGMWTGKMSGGLIARHVARTSLKAGYHFEKPEELERLADTARGLMAEFLYVLGTPAG